jgi:hypothetical protein
VTNTSPESANAATSDTVTASNTTSGLQTVVNAITAFYNMQAEAVAEVLGLWTAARAAVSTVASGVAAAATQSAVDAQMAKYVPTKVSPADLADMVIRNVLPTPSGASTSLPDNWPSSLLSNINGNSPEAEAALSGMNSERFDALVLDTGESYGIIDALRLYNRGGYLYDLQPTSTGQTTTPLYAQGDSLQTTYGISEAELYSVIAYSRVRPDYTDDLLKLSKNTISPAEAVEMAVKEIVSTAEAQNLYAAGGGIPEQFQALVDSAGDAAGLEHAIELRAQGVITDNQLQLILGMSRLNPRFYYLYQMGSDGTIPMHLRWLPPFELQRAVIAGTLAQDDAITAMTNQGYTSTEATLFFQTASLERIVSLRGATESQIATDWQAGLISQADAETALKNIGYQDWALPIIFDTYEARKVMAARNNVVSRVRSAVLVGGVDSATAVTDLTAVGFSSQAANEMVADWTVEANTPNKIMPYTVVGYLLEAQLMGTEDGINYFRRSGYTEQDAQLMTTYYTSGLGSKSATVAGTPGPVEEETPAAIPPPPTREDITIPSPLPFGETPER